MDTKVSYIVVGTSGGTKIHTELAECELAEHCAKLEAAAACSGYSIYRIERTMHRVTRFEEQG